MENLATSGNGCTRDGDGGNKYVDLCRISFEVRIQEDGAIESRCWKGI